MFSGLMPDMLSGLIHVVLPDMGLNWKGYQQTTLEGKKEISEYCCFTIIPGIHRLNIAI